MNIENNRNKIIPFIFIGSWSLTFQKLLPKKLGQLAISHLIYSLIFIFKESAGHSVFRFKLEKILQIDYLEFKSKNYRMALSRISFE